MKGNIAAIILAAGRGCRFGSMQPKQFEDILGQPVFIYSIYKFLKFQEIQEIILAVPRNRTAYVEKRLSRLKFSKNVKVITGGKRRRDSVFKALMHVDKNTKYVVIHDAARPVVSDDIIRKVISGMKKYGACIPVITPADTVKIISQNNFVLKTMQRDKLGLVQTPQGFLYKKLMDAYKYLPSDMDISDDAQVLENIRQKISVVPGSAENIKITWREDIYVVKSFLKRRKR